MKRRNVAKFKIPCIVRPIKLGDYQPEYGDTTIWTWVNPPDDFLRERQEMLRKTLAAQKEIVAALEKAQGEITDEEKAALEAVRSASVQKINEAGDETMRWIARAWSQHTDTAEHWTVEEVQALVAETAGEAGTDPGLWTWLVGRTLEMVVAYRSARKKG